MSTAWVTGAAGFIGSHLAEYLSSEGWDVVALDSFNGYYSESQKRQNWQALGQASRVKRYEVDLLATDFTELAPPDCVFHLAGQPGVRPSWGSQFMGYLEMNPLLTQRIAEFCAGAEAKMVYASSSSVYGVIGEKPASEADVTVPHSPYGITKLASELVVRTYSANLGLKSASMRYFTVYGPRQRPDMAMHRLCEAAITGKPFPLMGDGSQIREFTFVDDVVRATAAAADVASTGGEVFNVAGGASTTLNEVVGLIEELVGASIALEPIGVARGDVPATRANIDRARTSLGWTPSVELAEGLQRQVEWHLTERGQ